MVYFTPFVSPDAFSPFSVLNEFESPVYRQPLALSTPIFAAPVYTPSYCRPRRQRAPVRRSVASPLSLEMPSTYRAITPRLVVKPSSMFKPALQPKFEIRDTADAYELHGNLEGLDKKDVEIEFVDPQTLTVCGRVQRNSLSSTVPATADKTVDAEGQDTQMSVDTEPETSPSAEPETRAPRSPSPSTYRKATVEDSPDEDDRLSITSMTSTRSSSSAGEKRPIDFSAPSKSPKAAKVSQPSSSAAERAIFKAPVPSVPAKKTPPKNTGNWDSERSFTQFSRTFTFPERIRPDRVHATLNDGILSVVVPKARQEARQVIIF
ncbi:30 kDa heat shock protein [Ceratocystis lukuohia]|uniref:30 kDa heat shock protein n=1 Tax=Ceratocystis lukuohia TaxID=2019550 RepID=A0ABR4MRY4_9PEZI